MAGRRSTDNPRLADVVLRRIARLADGWCPNISPNEAGRATVARVRGYTLEAGRDPAALGLDGRLKMVDKQPKDWVDEVEVWRELGATHLSVETRRGGLSSAEEHIDAIRRFKEAVDG